jgi:hypothetical protein
MRNGFLAEVAVCALLATSAFAQSKTTVGTWTVGTWKLDVAHSDFGSPEPAPKSVTINILKDTPEMLSWRVHMIDDKGKAISYSWKGPKDGSMHPVMQNGKEIGKQSAKEEGEGGLHRHGDDPDGSTFDAHSKISDDGKTINEETTAKFKDGKESKSKTRYHRVSGTKKTAENKPEA